MNNTLQLYVDDEKTIKGYPVTSPDRVIDENGKSVRDKLKNNVKFDVVGQGVGAPPIDGGNAELVEKVDKLEEQMCNIGQYPTSNEQLKESLINASNTILNTNIKDVNLSISDNGSLKSDNLSKIETVDNTPINNSLLNLKNKKKYINRKFSIRR